MEKFDCGDCTQEAVKYSIDYRGDNTKRFNVTCPKTSGHEFYIYPINIDCNKNADTLTFKLRISHKLKGLNDICRVTLYYEGVSKPNKLSISAGSKLNIFANMNMKIISAVSMAGISYAITSVAGGPAGTAALAIGIVFFNLLENSSSWIIGEWKDELYKIIEEFKIQIEAGIASGKFN